MSAAAWVLWGRMKDGTPIRIMQDALPAVRKELEYRKPLQTTGGFTDLRIRIDGQPYDSCSCEACGQQSHDPNHPSWEVRY